MKKKTATKPKRKIKPQQQQPIAEIEDILDGLPPIDYVALSVWGRFVLAGLFFRKAFACLFKGQATV